jgi:RNA polymerase sigma-70 factor (ECF subfamily)
MNTARTTDRPHLSVISNAPITKASPDSDLVVACQGGNQLAFNILLKRHERYVYGLLHKMAPDWKQQHEDLSQEIFVRIFKSIHTLRNPGAFKGWVNQVATNLFYDELRKRPRLATISLDEPLSADEDAASRDVADLSQLPDENCERQEIVNQVTAAIAKLPEQFKNVIVLREFHGLPYDEIAVLTKSEVGTVKSRIARARAKIQVHLNPLKVA